ncbi:hypothetical protein UFOVP1360_44 [uncultured Caudovirales phage]|uniref:Calcineurin-like phosphoesterase domain-containing protein n=1 Tax=uncultured Caudovirales phage TaxID=2100421 RepID=A0A6J5S2V3_9CAUD|nr:hypothetical protein UFOVP1360_44 [uncultured Caudovirales phage]
MPDLEQFAAETEDGAKLAKVTRQLAAERREHNGSKRLLTEAEARVGELERLLDRYTVVRPGDTKVPKWLAAPKGKQRQHHATALLQLSDLHLDEVVDLDAMAGMNAYDRDIATKRLERIVEGVVKLSTTYVGGVVFDGIVVALNGDILSGMIHEELAYTNEAPTPASIAHWVPLLASALDYLADHFGAVLVVCTDGNHDRTYRKIPAKQRAESSYAWIVYNWLADLCRPDDRISFKLTTAESQVYDIYSTTFHQVHGDGFRSAGGVGGIYPSMLKYIARMDQLWAQQGTHIDCHLFGHWHQYLTGPNFIVNGSLKGYDEYAKRSGFGFEKARQALAIITPERGIVQQMPVYAD